MKLVNNKLKYHFKIQESVNSEDGDSLTIKGVAINATTTRNGHTFIAKELKKAAPSLKDKPLLKDHNNSVDAIVGRTTDKVKFNNKESRIDFEAVVKDKAIAEKIEQGLITDVSVGAMVGDFEFIEETDTLILKDIEFVELSLVAVPADENANFAKASYSFMEDNLTKINTEKIKEQITDNNDTVSEEITKDKEEVIEETKEIKETIIEKNNSQDTILEDKTMTEENQNAVQEELKTAQEKNVALEEQVKAFKEQKLNTLRDSYKEKCKELKTEVREDIDKLTKETLEILISEMSKIKIEEPKKEVKSEKVDETKGKVDNAPNKEVIENALAGITIEENGSTGYNFFYENYSDDCKRLKVATDNQGKVVR